jgi:hypothetical protein
LIVRCTDVRAVLCHTIHCSSGPCINHLLYHLWATEWVGVESRGRFENIGCPCLVIRGVGRAGIIYTLIGKALASSSNFFINYIMVQALMTMPYRMVLPTVMPLFDLCRYLRIFPSAALPPFPLPFPPPLFSCTPLYLRTIDRDGLTVINLSFPLAPPLPLLPPSLPRSPKLDSLSHCA